MLKGGRDAAPNLLPRACLRTKTWVLKTWVLKTLGSEDLGFEDLGSTAFVRLKMAQAAELACKLYHNSPDRVLPASAAALRLCRFNSLGEANNRSGLRV